MRSCAWCAHRRPLHPEGFPAGARPGDRGRRVRDQHGLLVLRDADPGVPRCSWPRPCSTWSCTTGCPTSRSATAAWASTGARGRIRRAGSCRSTWRSASATARSGCGSSSCGSAAGPRPSPLVLARASRHGSAGESTSPTGFGLTLRTRHQPWMSAVPGFTTTCEGSSRASCSSSRSSAPRYAHDASLYEIDPLGVIVPRTEQDVVTAVRYAAENAIAVHARGAGTGPGGRGARAGPGHRLQPPLPADRLDPARERGGAAGGGARRPERPARPAGPPARSRPGVGVVHDRRDDRRRRGRARVAAYGSTGDQVERLRVVFANGEIAEVGRGALARFDDEPSDFKDVVVRKLGSPGAAQRRADRTRIARCRAEPRGLRLRARRDDATGIDLARLIVGSEGTLALVTEATLADGADPGRPGGRAPAVRAARRRRRGGRRLPEASPPRPATSTTGGRSAWSATRSRPFATGSPRRPSRS